MDDKIPFPDCNQDLIGSVTVQSGEDIIIDLTQRGCPDLTTEISLVECSSLSQGGGGFFEVHQGRLKNGKRIAIKSVVIHDGPGKDSKKDKILGRVATELYLWSKLKHSNILPLMGLAMFQGRFSIISEWMENDSLTAYISLNPKADRTSLVSDALPPRKWYTKYRDAECIDICTGLSHIHANDMIHGDIKAANIMVSRSGVAMITDFGNSQLKDLTLRFTNTTTASFSVRWAAPELLLGEGDDARVSKESDVYAYGMTALETLTGKIPFEEFSEQKVLTLVALQHQTPPRPKAGISNETWQLLQRCWARGKTTRPEIRVVEMLLRNIYLQARIETKKQEKVRTVRFKAEPGRTGQLDNYPKYFQNRLRTLSNIAGERAGKGQLTEAELLGLEVMAFQKRVLGENHPDILQTTHILALTYEQQDRLAEAESVGVQVILARGEMLGENHPDTLRSINNLAITYMRQGRLAEAELLSVAVVAVIKRVLGDDHPDTLQSMNTLAVTYEKQDRLVEAGLLGAEVVAARKRVLGESHLDTLQSMANLAVIYTQLDRLAEAELLEAKVVTARKRVLGTYHPDTLQSMMNLAMTYEEQGRLEEAESLEIKVVAFRKRVLGEDHPKTLHSMHALAFTYEKNGRLAEAESLSAEVVATRKRVLGEDHSDTLLSMGVLALSYELQGRLLEAESLVGEVLAARERILGKYHPDTVGTMRWLGRIARANFESLVTQVNNLRRTAH